MQASEVVLELGRSVSPCIRLADSRSLARAGMIASRAATGDRLKRLVEGLMSFSIENGPVLMDGGSRRRGMLASHSLELSSNGPWAPRGDKPSLENGWLKLLSNAMLPEELTCPIWSRLRARLLGWGRNEVISDDDTSGRPARRGQAQDGMIGDEKQRGNHHTLFGPNSRNERRHACTTREQKEHVPCFLQGRWAFNGQQGNQVDD
jgi:hypothetical protein